jgi:FtsP/CotA-like multicopper oxidase with cupredoxin domain
MKKDRSRQYLMEAVHAFAHHALWRLCKPSLVRVALTGLALLVLSGMPVSLARAQTPTPTPSPSPSNPCPTALMPGQTLIPVPVLDSSGGRLRGTIILSDEQQWMTFRVPPSAPTDSARSQCQPQYVRMFREYGARSSMASAPYGPFSRGQYALPRPGPTLRARVGDLVQLTFVNQIQTLNFGDSIDRGETGRDGGCDSSSAGYPGGDQFPDCFHGSSTGNIHYHGTHTNPNTTADNVFIEVRPSLRENDGTGAPKVTRQSVAKQFDSFFTKCEVELSKNVLREWPTKWDDLPDGYTDDQKRLLKEYDDQMQKKYGPGVRKLWPIDEAQIKEGAWPQYYIGAFPYCFRLPEFKGASTASGTHGFHTGGAGMAELHAADAAAARPLMMGQAPGTHWYHAHKHGSTAINVANGMTGAFIIEGQYDDDLNAWYGTGSTGAGWTRDAQVLVVNQLGVTPNLVRGAAGQQDKGPDFSVNSQMKPVLSMQPGQVQMWRIVNTSGRAAMYFMDPPAGFEWKQIAQDGVQFNDYNYKNRKFKNIVVAPGNRVDLLVKAPPTPCAKPDGCVSPVLVKNIVDPADLTQKTPVGKQPPPPAQPLTLLSVNVSGTPVDPTSNQAKFIPNAPGFPKFLDDISDDEVTGTKEMVFGSTPPSNPPAQPAMHTIDGKKFDGEVGAVVLLNTVEEWKIMNATYGPPIAHPFHIHINPFQVTEIFDPNQTFNFTYTNPRTRKPSTATGVLKYAFTDGDLFKSQDPLFQAAVRRQQCRLDPFADRNDWKPCGPKFVNKNNIWWDVFPIPSGKQVTTERDQIDPNTKKPVIDPKTGKPVKVVVSVPGYFKMRSRFVDYAGQYVIHCHILAHEDRGMMTIVEVAPVRTPYSHH